MMIIFDFINLCLEFMKALNRTNYYFQFINLLILDLNFSFTGHFTLRYFFY
jgi:hypothetical protein